MAFTNKLTVEIPLFFTFVSFMITEAVFTNLVVYRSCYILLEFNKTECAHLGNSNNNITQRLERLVQPKADVIIMTKSLVDALFPILVCMIAGPWSDKFGRKPVLLMTLTGMATGAAIMVAFSYFEDISPWFFLLSSLPGMLTGGATTYFTVTLSYLSDISTEDTRGIRMAIYEAAVAGGVLLGNISSSYIFYATNYQTVFGIGLGCMVIGVIYMIIFVPESLTSKESDYHETSTTQSLKVQIMKIVQLTYLTKMIHTSVKRREKYTRTFILLIMAIVILFNFVTGADSAIQFIFLREKLNWTLTKFTLYNSVNNVLWVVSTLAGTFIFHKYLKIRESVLALVGLTSLLSCTVLQLIADSDAFIYTAGAVKCFGGLVAPMLRAQVSRLVSADEVGKVFSMIYGGGALIVLGATPLYTMVYNATININSALYNLVSIGLIGTTVFLIMIIIVLEHKSSRKQKNEEETKQMIPKI